MVSNEVAIRLSLFRTESRSQPWGVRLLESVEANTFICEVNGQVRKEFLYPIHLSLSFKVFFLDRPLLC